MIRVTIEMCPFGDESKPRTIATFKIANVGGTHTESIYEADAVVDDMPSMSTILTHNRDDGVIVLVERVLARFR